MLQNDSTDLKMEAEEDGSKEDDASEKCTRDFQWFQVFPHASFNRDAC